MATKVLNKTHREILIDHAGKLVWATEDQGPRDSTYEAAADMARSLVDKKYPPADMAILQKYDVAHKDSCVYVLGYGGVERFSYRSGDARIPYVPERYCNNRTVHLMDEGQTKILDAYKLAEAEFQTKIKQRIADYKALIENARTFEELVEIWPAADQLRERICAPAAPYRS